MFCFPVAGMSLNTRQDLKALYPFIFPPLPTGLKAVRTGFKEVLRWVGLVPFCFNALSKLLGFHHSVLL